ncbi:MAG: hypothetical protein QX192_03325 [Methylococcales bacterium]
MTNLEKAQAWVDSRADEGRVEDATEILFEWTISSINTGRDIDEIAEEKYGWVLRSIELANSNDPFSIMTAVELAFAERMCDLEPRVYLEGAALEEHEKGMEAARIKGLAADERSRLERIKNPPVTRKIESFEEMF